MPDLYFKVGMVNGKATLSEMKQLDQAYNQAGQSGAKHFHEADRAASVFGGTLNNIKHIAVGLGATFGLMGGAAMFEHWVEGAIEAEKVWANVTTLLDTTAGQTKELYHELKNVSSQLGTTAELAQGMYYALSANIAPEKAVKFVETAAKFGKAALVDIATSTDLLTTVVNAYGMKTEEAAAAADKLFTIVRKGKTTGADLAGSLGMVIPTAAALKVDLNQVGAAFVTMTQMGINAHMATTSLNQALVTFLKPTKQAVELAKQYGIELTAASLRSKGLAKSMSDLAMAVQGDDEAIAAIFGNIRAMRAALSLTGEQAGVYNQTLKQMADATGAVDKAVDKQVNTTGAQLTALWTNIGKVMKGVVDTGKGPLYGFLVDLNNIFEKGVAPVHKMTYAIIGFGLALAGLKIATTISEMKALTISFGLFSTFMDARKILDFGSALKLTLNGMGMLGKAISVVAVATAAWSLTRLIMETFDLDKNMESLWKRIGLFQGRVAEATEMATKGLEKASAAMKTNPENVAMAAKMGENLDRNGRSAEEWAAALGRVSSASVKVHQDTANAALVNDLTQRAAILTAHYGDKLKLLEVDVRQGTRSVKEWSEAIADAEKRVKQKIPLTQEEAQKVKELGDTMFKAANPAAELANELTLLARANKNVGDFAHAFSKQILDAIAMTEQVGSKVPKSIAVLKDEAQAWENAKQKVAEYQAEQKKLKELNEKGMPRAIADLNNPELQAGAQAWIKHAAAVAKSKDATLTESEALQVGIEKLKWFDGIVTKNKESLREQTEEFMKQHSFIEIMKKDYDELGISMDKSTLIMEKAYRHQKESGLMSIKEQTDAVSNMVRTAAEQHEQLSTDVLRDLESMATGTDVNVREKMLPVWLEYYKSLRDGNGQFPVEYQQKLVQIMTSNDRVLKAEMYPAWQDYIESVKKLYGTLPPGLDKLNTKIVEQMDNASGKLAQVFKDQVSTIFTDFSKGVADMIFESKSMTETIVGILKEFGKMAVRTLMEAFMNPIKKMMTGLVDDLMKALQGGGSNAGTGDVMGAIAGGGQNGGGGLLGGVTDIVSGVTKQGSDASMAGGFGSTSGKYTSFLGKLLSGQDVDFIGGKGSGAFFEKGGGLNGKGVGGAGGALMTTAGMMMAMDSLNRKGLKGAAEGGIGGAMAGYAMGGWQGAGIGAGATLFTQGMLQGGAQAWMKAIGGGALVGFSIAGPIGALVGAAVGGISKGIGALVSWAKGKSNAEAGTDEIARDFGGVKMGQDQYNQLTESFGFPKDSGKLWKHRGSVAGAPQMLDQIFQLAKQQGKLTEMYEDMDTAWGGFHKNFTEGLQIGELTGDWTKLNEEWKKSTSYADLVNAGLKDQADAMMMNSAQVEESAKSFETMYQEVLKTGTGYEELAKYLEENRENIEAAIKDYPILTGQLARMDMVIANMKENAAALSELKTLKNGFESLKQSLNDYTGAAESAMDTFLNEGIITEQFRLQVEKLGGDISKFEQTAGLLKISKYFGDLIDTFKETGVVTSDLRRIMVQFGGDISVLKDAVELQGLKKALGSMNDFRSGIQQLFPEVTGLQKVLQGVWDDDTVSKLQMEGLDPAVFEKITKLIHGLTEWESAIADFEQTGRLTVGGVPEIARQVMETAGLTSDQLDKVQNMFKGSTAKLSKSGQVITDMLKMYGGEEGKLAVERLGAGFTTVTTSLLETTKANMEAAYKLERENVLASLDTAQQQIQARADEIEAAITSQFDVVAKNIQDAFATARVAALEELDKILEKITEVTNATLGLVAGLPWTVTETPTASTDTTVPGAASGAYIKTAGLLQVHEHEQILNADSTRRLQDLIAILKPVLMTGTMKPESIIDRAIQGMNAAYGDAREESLITRATDSITRQPKEDNRSSQTGSSNGEPVIQATLNNYGTIYGLDDFDDRVKRLVRDTMNGGGFSGVGSGYRRA